MNLKSANTSKNQILSDDNLNSTKSSKFLDKSQNFGINKFSKNNCIPVIKTQFFNLQDSVNTGKRTYLKIFDAQRTTYVASEILFSNPFYKQQSVIMDGVAVWFQDDEEVGRNNFKVEVKKEWEVVEIVQSWGTQVPGFWKSGECKIEIYLNDELVSSKEFYVNDYEVIDFALNENEKSTDIKNKSDIEENNINPHYPTKESESLESILKELNNFVGLNNLKHSLADFITYLNFLQERKKQGIESNENISAHSIFLGNPGTGKTSIARLLGRFFKSIGLLEHGHVIEVDRSALVGEFIGQTAQKTENVIQKSLGGILFIDEAYSLKRDNDSKDFGQEAIDILLKRMEDLKGKFFVIAAGYPTLMQIFLNSNPGLKSRFTHTFTFDDYTPEELTKIYKIFSAKDNFNLSRSAEKLLKEKFDLVLETADETFGNARFVRNLFNETKIHLSKRYQLLPYEERNYSSLSTIVYDDILAAFKHNLTFNPVTGYKEDKLEKYVNELNDLIGLDDVKNTFTKLLAAIKIDKMKKERGISSNSKNLNSIFISEPGSGTSTVARLLGKIFKELSLLQSGQLIELDSSSLYGLNKIDSYLFLDKLFQDSIGKIILVNDSIITLQAKKDFSDSLLQYFLKKLYINQNDISAIICGSEEEIAELFISVPVVQNQFSNIFNFGQYSNRQLLEIALKICNKKNYQLDEGAWQQMLEILSNLREENNRNFYNARTIKEILNKAIANQEERIISIKNPKDSDLMTLTYEDFAEI